MNEHRVAALSMKMKQIARDHQGPGSAGRRKGQGKNKNDGNGNGTHRAGEGIRGYVGSLQSLKGAPPANRLSILNDGMR